MSINFGFVYFDDPIGGPSTGWASIDGAPATRIRHPSELPSDIQWWTNLPFNSYIQSGLAKTNRFRHSDYLRVKQQNLIREIGIGDRFVEANRAASSLSEIYARCMRLLHKHYGIHFPKEDSLAAELRPLLADADRSVSVEIDEAGDQSSIEYTLCSCRKPWGTTEVTFQRPRLQHAIDVLQAPVPKQQWMFVAEKDMPPVDKRVEWILSQSRPALVKIVVERINPDWAPLVAFGSTPRKVPRNWVTHPYLLLLSRFADIRVEAAFFADDYTVGASRVPLIDEGMVGPLSLSVGILAENHWSAMARETRFQHSQGRKFYSPRAAWMRSADNFHCLVAAMQLYGAGFPVVRYGCGSVGVAIAGNMKEATDVAKRAGLLPPITVGEDILVQAELA